jgi:hypothetical protein
MPTITVPKNDEFDSDFLSLLDLASPASRAVMLLHDQQHLSLEETAAILDIPLGTAKSRLSYGVFTVRNFLKEKQKLKLSDQGPIGVEPGEEIFLRRALARVEKAQRIQRIKTIMVTAIAFAVAFFMASRGAGPGSI